jgi:hypothetical protein
LEELDGLDRITTQLGTVLVEVEVAMEEETEMVEVTEIAGVEEQALLEA